MIVDRCFPTLSYFKLDVLSAPPADDFEELLSDNRTAFLRTVADELQQRLPLDAMLPSESTAYRTVPETGPGPGQGGGRA